MAPPFPYAGYSEDICRRVRVLFNGQFVVDVQKPKLVWEHPFYPIYYFSASDVSKQYIQNEKSGKKDSEKTYDLVVGSKIAPGAVTIFTTGDFKDLIKITFNSVDAWFEEDERVYVHPKDPYKRIQIIQSSKHVRVEIDGIEVASSKKPLLLYETGLPLRYYLPMTDVRLDLITNSTTVTSCPYKGDASYFDINLPSGRKEGLVWWYKTPTTESNEIKGHVAFYNEKVDIWVNGVLEQHP